MTTKRKWRERFSNYLYDYWLERGHQHKLQFMHGEHQTPEFRIAEDAKVSTELPIDLVLGLFWSILSGATFISVLWNVGGDLQITLYGSKLVIPNYQVFAVVAYSIVVATATMSISRKLTATLAESKRTEAELRALGSALRESGERFSVQELQNSGRQKIGQAFDQVILKSINLCWQNMRMTFVSHSNFILAPIIALILCMPKYVEGALTLGEVVQVSAAFVIVQSAFNWITDSYGNIAEWISSASRVATLLIAIDDIEDGGFD